MNDPRGLSGDSAQFSHVPQLCRVVVVIVGRRRQLRADGDAAARRDLTHFVGDGARVDAGVAPGRGTRHDQSHGTVRVQSHVVLTARTKADPVSMPFGRNIKSINQKQRDNHLNI